MVALAHAADVSLSALAGAWEAPPAILAGALVAALLFAHAWLRLRRRGRPDLAGWDRVALFGAGLVVAVLALVSPLDAAGEQYLLSAHMLQHVVIGDLGPALIVVALRGPLLIFLLPAAVLAPLARLAPVRTALGFLVRPPVAIAVWALVVGAWHLPAAYDYTLTHRVVHDLEHVTFVLAGFLAWMVIVDPARRGELRVAGRVAACVLLFAFGQVLADVLLFSFDPLYGPYAAQEERLLGLSPLTDQRLAGVVMMAEQALTLGTAVALLLLSQHREVLRREAERGRAHAA
jgi:putative membrane protein